MRLLVPIRMLLPSLMRLQNPFLRQSEPTLRLRLRLRQALLPMMMMTIRRESSSPCAHMMRVCPRITVTENLASPHRLENSYHFRIKVRVQSRRMVRRQIIIVPIDGTRDNLKVIIGIGGGRRQRQPRAVRMKNKRLHLLKFLAP
jgi:hypothetical protein